MRKHIGYKTIQNGYMRLIRVPTDPTSKQLADILTKGLHVLQWQ